MVVWGERLGAGGICIAISPGGGVKYKNCLSAVHNPLLRCVLPIPSPPRVKPQFPKGANPHVYNAHRRLRQDHRGIWVVSFLIGKSLAEVGGFQDPLALPDSPEDRIPNGAGTVFRKWSLWHAGGCKCTSRQLAHMTQSHLLCIAAQING
jgi:hypothetical protein